MFGFMDTYKNKILKNTEEIYLLYKEKYGDKIILLKKGDIYGIDTNKLHNSNRPIHFHIDNINTAKEEYIKICKDYQQSLQPIEVC